MKNDAFRLLEESLKNRIHWLHGRRFYFSGTPKEILYLIQHVRIKNYDQGTVERMKERIGHNDQSSYLFYFDKSE